MKRRRFLKSLPAVGASAAAFSLDSGAARRPEQSEAPFLVESARHGGSQSNEVPNAALAVLDGYLDPKGLVGADPEDLRYVLAEGGRAIASQARGSGTGCGTQAARRAYAAMEMSGHAQRLLGTTKLILNLDAGMAVKISELRDAVVHFKSLIPDAEFFYSMRMRDTLATDEVFLSVMAL